MIKHALKGKFQSLTSFHKVRHALITQELSYIYRAWIFCYSISGRLPSQVLVADIDHKECHDTAVE